MWFATTYMWSLLRSKRRCFAGFTMEEMSHWMWHRWLAPSILPSILECTFKTGPHLSIMQCWLQARRAPLEWQLNPIPDYSPVTSWCSFQYSTSLRLSSFPPPASTAQCSCLSPLDFWMWRLFSCTSSLWVWLVLQRSHPSKVCRVQVCTMWDHHKNSFI